MNASPTIPGRRARPRVRTAVLVLFHNRPEQTARTLRAVAAARPSLLLLAGNGPAPENPADDALCALAREVAERTIGWDCQVSCYHARTRLSAGLHATSGISWAFEQADEVIVLDDGCVPGPTFWAFCDELLAHYRSDERVMHIGGNAHFALTGPANAGYHFTQFPDGCGWASWKRAWRHFDVTAKLWPVFRRSGCLESVARGNASAREFFTDRLRSASLHPHNPPSLDYWREQWMFACWANSGLGIAPRQDLVTPPDAAPEPARDWDRADSLPFRLAHPRAVVPSYELDRRYLRDVLLPRLKAWPASPAANAPHSTVGSVRDGGGSQDPLADSRPLAATSKASVPDAALHDRASLT